MINNKKVELLQVFELIKKGYIPSKISKKFSIPKGTLAYHVAKLKKLGCIENPSYGVWNVIKPLEEVRNRPKGSQAGQSNKKQIRGHAFIWKIEFVQPYDWVKVISHYKKKNLSFGVVCNGKVPRTIFKSRKIWMTKKGLVIYEPVDFLGKSSFQVKGTAVFEMDRLVKGFLRELGIRFKYYRFTTSREHYGMIKNELARQYNDRKEKLIVKGEDGTTWLWIDDSKGLAELETNEPNISRQVQNFWNDHKKHKFQVTPSLLLKAIKGNADNFKKYADNIESHIGAIKTLGAGVETLSTGVKTQNKLFERIAKVLEKLEK